MELYYTHYISQVKNSECPPGRPNISCFMPEQSGGRSFWFPVNKMDVNSCYPFCELPNVNGCTNETHELVRITMPKDELEFPSKATEAKIYFYFHYKKYRITTTLILTAFIIGTTQTLYCADILLMGRKFLERKFLRRKFL